MDIQWNSVTWYSRLGALLFFLFVLPTLTFCIGREYEKTLQTISLIDSISPKTGGREHTIISPYRTNSTRGASVSSIELSGVRGEVLVQNRPLSTHLIVKDQKGKTVTETVSDKDGKFFLTLPPGSFTIESTQTKGGQASVEIKKGEFAIATIAIETNAR